MTSKNKIALVTGGSRGLGKNMAMHLAAKGIDVIITYQNREDAANEVVATIKQQGRKAAALQLNVALSNTFDVFTQKLQQLLQSTFNATHIDALVNNAGVGTHAPYAQTTESQFDQMVNIHLKAPYFLTQKLLPLLNSGSAVVNISSGLSRFSYPGYSSYAIMKGAIDTLSRYQAVELKEHRIRVNTIAPGAIETDFGGGAVRDNKQLNDMVASQTALGRVGLPDDIGAVVAFICSDESGWINGQRIEVSGGIHL
ncbi:MAG TPA: SDR family oxidoreductase [Chitinophagales bacterium]|nr:SDR family oxidoreductase [Chitinophagales bacterium]